MDKQLEDYLQEGIHGAREIHPEERRMFLGNLQERVELALTKGQVMQPTIYSQVEIILQSKQEIQLFMNGAIPYTYLSKYVHLTNTHNIPFTIVQNNEGDTHIGLVVAHSTAIEHSNIFIKDAIFTEEMKE